MHDLKNTIEAVYEQGLREKKISDDARDAVLTVLEHLDQGKLRVAEKKNSQWITNQWIKKAVLLSFLLTNNVVLDVGFTHCFDKVPLKFSKFSKAQFDQLDARIVPPACIRRGAYIAPSVVVMPSFINIGAYIDSGSMVDTWGSVGSCAQIGKNVHISGGAGIGGVLEPIQQTPTIIEDYCFIGARSEIAEGVIVEEGTVISMGVFIGQSTPIYHHDTKQIYYGRVPAGSVVIPGSLPSKDKTHNRYAAIIVKEVDHKTRGKTMLNEWLREVGTIT